MHMYFTMQRLILMTDVSRMRGFSDGFVLCFADDFNGLVISITGIKFDVLQEVVLDEKMYRL